MTYYNNINYFKILQHNTSKSVVILIGELHTINDCSNIGFNTPYGIGDLLTDIANALPRAYTPNIYIECPNIAQRDLTTPSMMFNICYMNQYNHLDNYIVDKGIDIRHDLPELVEIYRLAIMPYFAGSTPAPRNLTRIIEILLKFKEKYYNFITRRFNRTIEELSMQSASINRIYRSLEMHFTNLERTLLMRRNRLIDPIATLDAIRADLYPIILSGLDISIVLRLRSRVNTDFIILYTGSDHCETMSQFLFYNNNIWHTLYEGNRVGTNCITIDTRLVLDIMRTLPLIPQPNEIEMEILPLIPQPNAIEMEMGFGQRSCPPVSQSGRRVTGPPVTQRSFVPQRGTQSGRRKKNKSHTRSSLGKRVTSLRSPLMGVTALAHDPLRVAVQKVPRSVPKVKRSPSPLRISHFGRRTKRSPSPLRISHFGRQSKRSPSPLRISHFGRRSKRSPSPLRISHFRRRSARSPGPVLKSRFGRRSTRSPSPLRVARFKRSPIVRSASPLSGRRKKK